MTTRPGVWDTADGSLDIATLHGLYQQRALTVEALVRALLERADRRKNDTVWISRVPGGALLDRARALDAYAQDRPDWRRQRPLLGIPFAVKDNIDVAGMPTTAACPAFAYTAPTDAPAVRKLTEAGALLFGKTNLDQFATGLVGTRSPYGIPINPIRPAYIPGGSSSGSAVAVAAGLVSVALGTDTAGSGRVPAALTNIVGLKPTRGLVSTEGVVPACRSLDCVSVFSGTVADAMRTLAVIKGYDPSDPFSRPAADRQQPTAAPWSGRFRFGLPSATQLEFFGDRAASRCFGEALSRLRCIGGEPAEIDFRPFLEAAALLYDGPWVAERNLAITPLLARAPETIHPDVRRTLESASSYSAMDAYRGYHRLKALQRQTREIMSDLDCLVVPSVGRAYRLDEVLADPLRTNANLGYYTNFVNLLDLSALAVPTALPSGGAPFGVTLIGNPFMENLLASLGQALHQASDLPIGATPHRPPTENLDAAPADNGRVRLCVSGAHMFGLPLNHQLLENQAAFVARARTAPQYRLFALEYLNPPRPGMVRTGDGVPLEVEIWELPKDRLGWFVSGIPSPLGIGTVELENGEQLKGFLCEPYAVAGAKDISRFGGWRNYLQRPEVTKP